MERWAAMSKSIAHQYNVESLNRKGRPAPGSRTLESMDTVRVDMQNVADYFWEEHPKELWHAKDIPTCRAPWPLSWITFRRPPTSNNEGSVIKIPEMARHGFGCLYSDLDMGETEWAGARKIAPGVDSVGQLAVFVFVAPDNPTTETVLYGHVPVFFDENGRAMGTSGTSAMSRVGMIDDRAKSVGGEAFMQTLMVVRDVVLMGFAFCHCKNVEREERDFADPEDAHVHPRSKRPKKTYYILRINDYGGATGRGGGSRGGTRALHICRGHFATYSEENPLFGKYAGTFWVPMHTRGSKTQGEVVKAYGVDP